MITAKQCFEFSLKFKFRSRVRHIHVSCSPTNYHTSNSFGITKLPSATLKDYRKKFNDSDCIVLMFTKRRDSHYKIKGIIY
jgi:hypothetical protein